MKSPIFIFSLPRSGSTLLQRILMSHKEIASVAEPWLMLPFVYAYKNSGIHTDYGHVTAYSAFEDFIGNLPEKEDAYYHALQTFATTLYKQQCLHNEMYFLDKTPRYYFIIPEIEKVFPNAKFIFLFRNPTHVMSSIIQTWGDGNLKILLDHQNDLYDGPTALSKGFTLLRDKAYGIQYEKLVTDPEKYVREICEYLEIPYDPCMLESFSVQNTKGRMGDPTGIHEYKQVSSKSLEKWKDTFNTPFRQKLLYKYIEDIDEEVLSLQGYSKINILNNIQSLYTAKSNKLRDRLDYYFVQSMKKLNIENYVRVRNKLNAIYMKVLRIMGVS